MSTSVAEVPVYTSQEFQLPDDPTRGYLLLGIPASPRAPHMVQVKGDNRYYGRGEKGNRILTEGEVARLYARRERWEVDHDDALQRAIEEMPFPPSQHLAYLVGFAQPIPPDRDIWRRAIGDGGVNALLADLAAAAGMRRTPHEPPPSFAGAPRVWQRVGSDMYVLDTAGQSSSPAPDDTLQVSLNVDGRARLFCGRAAQRIGAHGPDPDAGLYLFEDIVAGSVAAFAAILGRLLERADYLGPVDVGVAVLGIAEARTVTELSGSRMFPGRAYGAPTFNRTARVPAESLLAPPQLAMSLVGDLIETLAGADYDPFGRAS